MERPLAVLAGVLLTLQVLMCTGCQNAYNQPYGYGPSYPAGSGYPVSPAYPGGMPYQQAPIQTLTPGPSYVPQGSSPTYQMSPMPGGGLQPVPDNAPPFNNNNSVPPNNSSPMAPNPYFNSTYNPPAGPALSSVQAIPQGANPAFLPPMNNALPLNSAMLPTNAPLPLGGNAMPLPQHATAMPAAVSASMPAAMPPAGPSAGADQFLPPLNKPLPPRPGPIQQVSGSQPEWSN